WASVGLGYDAASSHVCVTISISFLCVTNQTFLQPLGKAFGCVGVGVEALVCGAPAGKGPIPDEEQAQRAPTRGPTPPSSTPAPTRTPAECFLPTNIPTLESTPALPAGAVALPF